MSMCPVFSFQVEVNGNNFVLTGAAADCGAVPRIWTIAGAGARSKTNSSTTLLATKYTAHRF